MRSIFQLLHLALVVVQVQATIVTVSSVDLCYRQAQQRLIYCIFSFCVLFTALVRTTVKSISVEHLVAMHSLKQEMFRRGLVERVN